MVPVLLFNLAHFVYQWILNIFCYNYENIKKDIKKPKLFAAIPLMLATICFLYLYIPYMYT